PFPSGRMWQPDTVTSIADADWGAVFGQAAGFGAIVVVAIVALLLNYSGLETAMRTDIDVDAELRHTGLGNLVNGAAGCPPGFVAFGMSSLGHRLGARTRSGIIVTAGILVAVLAFGAGSIALVPRLVAGGFLVYLGLGLLREWLVATWTRVSKVDYALIWLILLAIVTIGFLAGIALGVFAAIAIFLVEYSRVGIIRTTTTRSHFASDAERPLLDERLLAERGDRIAIITIQGYVFFGTAHSLADRVRSMWRSDSSIRFLVIDFRLVTGMDVSGVAAFTRLCRDTRMADVTVALTGVSPDVRRQLTPEVLPPAGADESSGVASLFATLDDGVRWAEQQQLDDVATAGLADPTRSAFDVVRRRLGRLDADSVDWLDQLQPTRSRQVGDLVGMFDASLVRREFVSGEALAVQGRDVADLVVLVDGSAEWIEYDGEAIVDRGHVAPGSDVIARDLYAGGRSSRTVIATSDGSVLVLPADAIDSLDAEHPELAAVLHRTMTERISYRAYRLASASRFLAR
ncbi:MAG: STAS domain-containing protein, partial [Actinomycetota bacterium]